MRCIQGNLLAIKLEMTTAAAAISEIRLRPCGHGFFDRIVPPPQELPPRLNSRAQERHKIRRSIVVGFDNPRDLMVMQNRSG